jgi:hypothetical protein
MPQRTLPPEIEKAYSRLEAKLRPVLAAIDNVPPENVFLPYRANDRIRLLTLQAWEVRYHVGLPYILRVLLRYYAKARRRTGAASSLGVPVRQLTGHASRRILEDAVLMDFPCGENVQISRQRMIDHILQFSPAIRADSNDIYIQKAEERRKMRRTIQDSYRRPWRGNPFLA